MKNEDDSRLDQGGDRKGKSTKPGPETQQKGAERKSGKVSHAPYSTCV